MTPKSDNHRFFIGAQNRGSGVRWTSFAIFNRFMLAPFFNRFDIDTEFLAQRRGCSLRSLYCSSYTTSPKSWLTLGFPIPKKSESVCALSMEE
jgi:hypothetical protein